MHSETLVAPLEIAKPRGVATLVDLLRERSLALRDKVAFRFVREADREVQELTYRGLFERSAAIAAELQSWISPGDRAMLVYPPGLEFVEAYFGCLLAGVVAVPVAAPARRRPGAPLATIRAAANPELVLTTSRLASEINWPDLLGYSSRILPRLGTDVVSTERRHMWRAVSIDTHDAAFLQYTSGSTSSPKGVVLSHANLLANAALIQHAFGTTADSEGVFWLPLYHDMGLIGGVLQPIYCGGTSTLLAAAAFLQRPALWLEQISARRATISGGPDFAYDLCVRKVTPEERAKLDLSSWQVAFTGAERIRARTLDRFADAFQPSGFRRESFFPCYGLAEATLMVSGGPRGQGPTIAHVTSESLAAHEVRPAAPDDPLSRSLVACGTNLACQRLLIVDPDLRRSLPENRVGEIWVSGPSVAQGYYNHPSGTAEAFGGYLAESGEGPYLRTGDLGFLRDGQLFVTGRLKDLLIIRGRNYYPDDVEQSVMGAHEALRPGACVAVTIDDGEMERLVIVQEVEPRYRELDSAAALQAVYRAVTAQHDIEIDTILLVRAGEIPRTSSGKPRRSACRELIANNGLAALAAWNMNRDLPLVEPTVPEADPQRQVEAAEVEQWLTQRIAARLNLSPSQLCPTTPFLEFGMGSLDAVELAAGLEKWLGRRLSPTALYNHPNIAALAKWLAATQQPGSADDVPGSTAPLPIVSPPLNPAQCLAEVQAQTDAELAAFIQAEMAKLSPPTEVG